MTPGSQLHEFDDGRGARTTSQRRDAVSRSARPPLGMNSSESRASIPRPRMTRGGTAAPTVPPLRTPPRAACRSSDEGDRMHLRHRSVGPACGNCHHSRSARASRDELYTVGCRPPADVIRKARYSRESMRSQSRRAPGRRAGRWGMAAAGEGGSLDVPAEWNLADDWISEFPRRRDLSRTATTQA